MPIKESDCAMSRGNASVESRLVLTVRSEVFNRFWASIVTLRNAVNASAVFSS